MEHLVDYHVHLLGHQDRQATEQSIRLFLDAATAKGLSEIGFADHDMYWHEMNLDLVRTVAAEYPQLNVLAGVEVDYRLGDEARIGQLLREFPLDFAIGSVHEIESWVFDIPGQEARFQEWDYDELYRAYFKLVANAARSGLFTTIGHLDLIKIFGIRPCADIRELADEALTAMAEHGVVMEINTNGRYKPVGEFYPEKSLVEEAKARGIAITLGSDAHFPELVGRDLPAALIMLQDCGVKSITGFRQRQPIMYPIPGK